MRSGLIALLFVTSVALAADEVMYIQSTNAKMYQDQSFSSSVISEIGKGEKVNVTSASGRWVKVTYKNNTGWISSFLLSKTPPLNKVTVLSDDVELGNNARRRASAVATAGATRGLTSDSRQRTNEDSVTNRRAVLQMEKFAVSESELKQFREEAPQ